MRFDFGAPSIVVDGYASLGHSSLHKYMQITFILPLIIEGLQQSPEEVQEEEGFLNWVKFRNPYTKTTINKALNKTINTHRVQQLQITLKT